MLLSSGMFGGMMQELPGVEVLTFHVATPPVTFPVNMPESIYYMERGVGALFLLRKGQTDVALSLIRNGEIFGEEGLFSPRVYSLGVGLLMTSTLYRVPKAVFLEQCRQHPDWAMALAQLATARQGEWAARIESLMREAAGPRLVRTLLELAEAFQRVRGASMDGSARIPLTQSTLANLVGVTRESVSHKLNELERQGLVQLERAAIEIPSLQRLHQFWTPLPPLSHV
jgi:CRP/FNR family transcriptional regulator, cyclic AMP receptor protein